MNGFTIIQPEKSSKFGVASCFALPIDSGALKVYAEDYMGVYYLRSGRGEVYSSRAPKSQKIATLYRGDVLVVSAPVGELRFEGSCEIMCVQIGLSTDSFSTANTLDESIRLGVGDDVIVKDYCRDIDASYVIFSANALFAALERTGYKQISPSVHVKSAIERIIEASTESGVDSGSSFFTQVLITELILELDRASKTLEGGNERVGRIKAYIEQNYTRGDLSLDDIAVGADINASYMQKLFKSKTGNTVYDYLSQCRINFAVNLMKHTRLAFIDIAVEAGFQNRQTFYNVFKKMTGYSPKTFKKFLSGGNTLRVK